MTVLSIVQHLHPHPHHIQYVHVHVVVCMHSLPPGPRMSVKSMLSSHVSHTVVSPLFHYK